jgi:hypothetical protein
MVWTFGPITGMTPEDTVWIMKYEALLKYAEDHGGNANVPSPIEVPLPTAPETTVKLGLWLSRQRSRKKKGTLREDRQRLLEELVQRGAFVWILDASMLGRSVGQPDDDLWIEKWNLLKKYADQHGDGNVSSGFCMTLDDGSIAKLGLWLKKQRQMKKSGKLKPYREILMQELVEQGKTPTDRRVVLHDMSVYHVIYLLVVRFIIFNHLHVLQQASYLGRACERSPYFPANSATTTYG